MWITLSIPSVPSMAARIRPLRLESWPASPSSRLLVSSARITATATSSRPISPVPITSKMGSLVIRVSPTPSSAKVEAGQRGEVLEQDHRQLGCLGAAYELDPGGVAPDLVGLADRRAEAERLHHDGGAEHHDRHPPPAAVELAHVARVLMDLVPLVVGLVEGEQAADAEQHDRHDEAVDVALAAVAEGVLGGRRPCGPCARRAAGAAGCPESATEWIASASIEDDCVSANARNFVSAMPVFASNAATTALVPPSVDMAAGYPTPVGVEPLRRRRAAGTPRRRCRSSSIAA